MRRTSEHGHEVFAIVGGGTDGTQISSLAALRELIRRFRPATSGRPLASLHWGPVHGV